MTTTATMMMVMMMMMMTMMNDDDDDGDNDDDRDNDHQSYRSLRHNATSNVPYIYIYAELSSSVCALCIIILVLLLKWFVYTTMNWCTLFKSRHWLCYMPSQPTALCFINTMVKHLNCCILNVSPQQDLDQNTFGRVLCILDVQSFQYFNNLRIVLVKSKWIETL